MPKRTETTKKKTDGWMSSPPVSPRLLTLKDAAQWLGLTVWAMRERIWNGHIPYVRFDGGRKIYVDVSDLESFIEKYKTTYV